MFSFLLSLLINCVIFSRVSAVFTFIAVEFSIIFMFNDYVHNHAENYFIICHELV